MRRRHYLIGLTALLSVSGCERFHDLLPRPDAGETDAAPPYVADGGVVYCGNRPCACSNGADDDGDDRIDGFDPECTGPYDDNEATFATGEKEGNPNCIDCFFDGDPTSSNDDCRIPTSCRSDGTNSGAFGMCNSCTPSDRCIDSCRSRTPNGCDCFGCCQIEDGMQTLSIQLAATCSMVDLADESKCPRCEVNMNFDRETSDRPCFNPCGRCELCAGKTLADLDSDCGDNGLGYDCEDDADVCGATNALCPGLAWCIQGCCAPILY